MIYLQLRVKMPDDELEPFLRAFRAWERARPELEAAVLCEATGLDKADLAALFARLDPPIPWVYVPRWPDTRGREAAADQEA